MYEKSTRNLTWPSQWYKANTRGQPKQIFIIVSIWWWVFSSAAQCIDGGAEYEKGEEEEDGVWDEITSHVSSCCDEVE